MYRVSNNIEDIYNSRYRVMQVSSIEYVKFIYKNQVRSSDLNIEKKEAGF